MRQGVVHNQEIAVKQFGTIVERFLGVLVSVEVFVQLACVIGCEVIFDTRLRVHIQLQSCDV